MSTCDQDSDSTSVARIPVATANRLTSSIQSVDMAWITRVEVQSPLPAGCRIDADRLQHINKAGRLANSAVQSGAAVPAYSRGEQR